MSTLATTKKTSRVSTAKPGRYKTGQMDIYFLGLTIVIGGQIIFWNKGLEEGFLMFFFSVILVGLGYLCLTFCLAEMTSMMPFAGGSFGYVRCTLGPVVGYLVGCCESAEYILYVATAVAEVGRLTTIITQLSPSFEPLYWMAFYIISLVIQCKGGRIFWRFNAVVAIVTTLLIVIHCLAALPQVDFSRYAIDEERDYAGFGSSASFLDTMYYFPLVCWFYVGVEAMTLSCDDIPQANRKVPWMMVASMCTLLVTSISICLAACSQQPGTSMLAHQELPLSPGYTTAFAVQSPQLMAILALPGAYSTAFGFMFAYGRQLRAMSRSGLLPAYLGQAWGAEGAPLTALVTGSVLGGGILLFLWFAVPNAIERLFGICMLSSCVVYVSIFCSFLTARTRLDTVPRAFNSPFGAWGARYGIVVFSVMAIALIGFQRDNGTSVTVFCGGVLLALAHYWFIARKREFLSMEEQAQFMKAYLLHSDAEYRRRMMRRSFATKQAFLRRVAPFNTLRAPPAESRPETIPKKLMFVTEDEEDNHEAHYSFDQQAAHHGGATDRLSMQQTDEEEHMGRASNSTTNSNGSASQGHLLGNTFVHSDQQHVELTGLHASHHHFNTNGRTNNHSYNSNDNPVTLELERKMRRLAEDIFAGQDEGHVTIVHSRHGRRALEFVWSEEVPEEKEDEGNAKERHASVRTTTSDSTNKESVSQSHSDKSHVDAVKAFEEVDDDLDRNNSSSRNQNHSDNNLNYHSSSSGHLNGDHNNSSSSRSPLVAQLLLLSASSSSIEDNDVSNVKKSEEVRSASNTVSNTHSTTTSDSKPPTSTAVHTTNTTTAQQRPPQRITRIIRLVETDSAVEIIPGIFEESLPPVKLRGGRKQQSLHPENSGHSFSMSDFGAGSSDPGELSGRSSYEGVPQQVHTPRSV